MCQPDTSNPSAPLRKAFNKKPWLTLPLHITRIKRTLLGYCMRDTPARSAPAYAHQLQTKASICGFGSEDKGAP
jgi:hypothetical protein